MLLQREMLRYAGYVEKQGKEEVEEGRRDGDIHAFLVSFGTCGGCESTRQILPDAVRCCIPQQNGERG